MSWVDAIRAEWKRRAAGAAAGSLFPLISQSFDDREIIAAVDTLLDGRITMGDQVARFEKVFAERLGVPYALMVNSGSSANLLAVAAAMNPARGQRVLPGDEVIVPAVAWSTSIWPWVQHGAKLVFVDVDPLTLNIDPADLRRKITSRTKAIMSVHVLGNCAPLDEVGEIVREHSLIWIEDTCESLGARYQDVQLGTLGDFGTFSFYYSHHITTGEGGMVVCRTLEDYDLMKCLRAHGWTRQMSNRAALESEHGDIDPRFLFVNVGFNLRPMEIQAAFGICQLERLETMNAARNRNREKLIAALRAHPAWKGQMTFPEAVAETAPAWFGFVCLLDEAHAGSCREFLSFLSSRGIENRPIISGNFTRQPALQLIGTPCDPADFPGAEVIHHRGFFLGIHTQDVPEETAAEIAGVMLEFFSR